MIKDASTETSTKPLTAARHAAEIDQYKCPNIATVKPVYLRVSVSAMCPEHLRCPQSNFHALTSLFAASTCNNAVSHSFSAHQWHPAHLDVRGGDVERLGRVSSDKDGDDVSRARIDTHRSGYVAQIRAANHDRKVNSERVVHADLNAVHDLCCARRGAACSRGVALWAEAARGRAVRGRVEPWQALGADGGAKDGGVGARGADEALGEAVLWRARPWLAA